MEKFLKNSSNKLHFRIKSEIENLGWSVSISPYFYDDTTEKPREIDIVAYKKFPINDVYENQKRISDIHTFLFIECKWFPNNIYFWVENYKKEEVRASILIDGLDKEKIFKESNLLNEHHYFVDKKNAKLWDVSGDHQNKLIFDAITKSVKTLIFEQEYKKDYDKKYVFYYPVVVYGGLNNFYLIENENQIIKEETFNAVEDLIFYLNYSYKRKDGSFKPQGFCVDIINEKNIQKFIKKVEREADIVSDYLSLEREISRSTLNKNRQNMGR